MSVTLETPLSRVLGPKTATGMGEQLGLHTVLDLLRHYPRRYAKRGEQADLADVQVGDRVRSEEHTSELQSRQYLVCRLLLEKKNKNTSTVIHSVVA